MSKKTAVMKGDGIGPEVVDSMLRVLKECNFQSEIILCEVGSEQWEKNGRKDASYIPDSTMRTLEETDCCFKGPTTTIPVPEAPRSVAVTLRQKFDLYANIRPTKTYDRLTPNRKLDCVCFREATEGLYTGVETKITDDAAIAIRKITRQGSRRLVDSAVDWANKFEMKKMVAITKRNILKQTDGIFWDETQKAVEGTGIKLILENPQILQDLFLQLNSLMMFKFFNINLFMDIISELASALVGSIGLIYSANIGNNYAMFEAAHGSAPQFAGQNKVNPTATVLSGAWMADYMGEREVRDAIFSATEQVINEGKVVTWDIGGNATTTQMTDAIITYAKNNLRK